MTLRFTVIQCLIPTYQPQGTAEGEYKSNSVLLEILQNRQQNQPRRSQVKNVQKWADFDSTGRQM